MFRDKKKLEIIKNLREKSVFLKPDKGNEVVLIRTIDYYTAVENLFLDKSKFKEIHGDPKPARLSSLQRYLKTLSNRNQVNDEVFKKIRPQNAKLARTHGVPKVLKIFNSIPSFRPYHRHYQNNPLFSRKTSLGTFEPSHTEHVHSERFF